MRLNLNVKHVNIESLKREEKNQTLWGLRKRAQQTKSRWLEKIPLSSLNGKFFASLSISLYTNFIRPFKSFVFAACRCRLRYHCFHRNINFDGAMLFFGKYSRLGTEKHLKMLIMQFYKFYDFHILFKTVLLHNFSTLSDIS